MKDTSRLQTIILMVGILAFLLSMIFMYKKDFSNIMLVLAAICFAAKFILWRKGKKTAEK